MSEKPRIAFIFVTGRAIQDAATAKWSYVDIFSNIVIPKESSETFQTFYIVGRLLGMPKGEVSVDIKIVNESGAVIFKDSANGTLISPDAEITQHVPLLRFTNVGRYYLKVSYKGKDISDDNRYYFDVIKPV